MFPAVILVLASLSHGARTRNKNTADSSPEAIRLPVKRVTADDKQAHNVRAPNYVAQRHDTKPDPLPTFDTRIVTICVFVYFL